MRDFFIGYFRVIDLLALLALAALACAAVIRDGNAWLLSAAGVLVAIWGTVRVMGWA